MSATIILYSLVPQTCALAAETRVWLGHSIGFFSQTGKASANDVPILEVPHERHVHTIVCE